MRLYNVRIQVKDKKSEYPELYTFKQLKASDVVDLVQQYMPLTRESYCSAIRIVLTEDDK